MNLNNILLFLVFSNIAKNIFLPTTNFTDSYPYITGCTFRKYSDFILDHLTTFNPQEVKLGSTIFVMYDYLDTFFKKYHPNINNSYILISHHFFGESDNPVPDKFASYLDNPKLAAWFTINPDRTHPKLHPLPLGIANQYYEHGNKQKFDLIMNKQTKKDKLLYVNFSTHTPYQKRFQLERSKLLDYFKNTNFATTKTNRIELENYLIDLSKHKFILSPRGNGLDTFRTWESLMFRSIPIVKDSPLNKLYKKLPVLIINNWIEVTENFLHKKYNQLKNKKYKWEKLYMPYWLKKINKYKSKILN